MGRNVLMAYHPSYRVMYNKAEADNCKFYKYGVAVTDAKLIMNTPVNLHRIPLYLHIVADVFANGPSSKATIKSRLSLKQGSYNSYFTALTTNKILKWNRTYNVWCLGENFFDWVKFIKCQDLEILRTIEGCRYFPKMSK